MDIEESKILLKDFKEGKIEKDKLENYTGGYKIGYFYTKDIQEAIDAVLSELEMKNTEIIEAKEANRQLSLELEKKDSLINEQLKENVRLQKELNEENKRCMILANNNKLKEQAIELMAKEIEFRAGNCPCGTYNYDLDCKKRCNNNYKECWIKYFTKKVTDNVGE